MKKFNELLTEAKETIVFTFGRFNPPTTGHEKLIKKVASVAGSNPFRIYPSHTANPKKDPLPHALKVAYMRKMFKKYSKNIIADKKMKTAIFIAEALYKEGFKNLVMVVGSDRVKEFSTLLNRYNDAPDKKGNQLFKFDSVKVVSAGERDPDSEGVDGMSASKMRAAAADGDKDAFLTGVPSSFKDGEKLYRDVRKYMGIREERDMGDMTDYETVRDMYLTGKIWNAGDIIEAKGVTGEVVRKGTNYLSFVDEDGKVHKAWLHEITIDEVRASRPRAGGGREGKAIEQNLAVHYKLTQDYIKQGMDKDKASKKAFDDVMKMKPAEKKRILAKEEIELDEKYDSDKFFDGKGTPEQRLQLLKLTNKALRAPGGSPKQKEIKKEIDALRKKMGMKVKEEVELDERNYRKEYDNYQGRPEQIARRSSRNKARRVMGDKTKIGMDVGHKDNDPMNNDPKNLRNEDPSKNRREPRLRKEEEIDLNLDEMKGLSPDVIKRLQKSFSQIKRFNSKTPAGKAIIAFVQDRSNDELESIRKAKIKHLSDLAKAELKDRKKNEEIELELEEGIMDKLKSIKGVAKNKIEKLKTALGKEKSETKKMLAIYKKGKRASKKEKDYANEQFKDLLKAVGLTIFTIVPIPAGSFLLAAVGGIAKKKFDINILPSAFYEDYGHYPGQVDPKKDKLDGGWVTGDPTKAIEFSDMGDAKSVLDKANKTIEKERGVHVVIEELDEDFGDSLPWLKKLKDKVFDKTHKKGLDNLSYEYAKRAAKEYKKNKRMNPIHIVHDLAKMYSNVTDRILRDHINDLVKKGMIPQELKAEYEPQNETMSFKDFVNQIQINEKLAKGASKQDYIDDFIKSDAPQFQGKSKEKRIKMAIAAFKAKG